MAKDDDVWFEPKRFGYGAGLPVAWQGWALLMVPVAAVVAASQLRSRGTMLAVEAAILTASLFLCARHTRGGWRWRWGE